MSNGDHSENRQNRDNRDGETENLLVTSPDIENVDGAGVSLNLLRNGGELEEEPLIFDNDKNEVRGHHILTKKSSTSTPSASRKEVTSSSVFPDSGSRGSSRVPILVNPSDRISLNTGSSKLDFYTHF